ncbi:MAG TPA: hypothetical protein PKO18_03830 [Chitinophagales bacterium]|nr:hypothetical protein [Chitinophagales bacterium]HNL84344.1 hypothetical protein [Chitinophagales bacterium]
MNNNLSFHPTLLPLSPSKDNDKLWEEVLKKYDEKQYAESVRTLVVYIDKALEDKYANADKTEYFIPHGSVTVGLKISEDTLFITAPFLDISTAKQVPLLRQVAQINFSPLTLSRIDLTENQLTFNFSCPLTLCEPYKIYDVLREVCINADNYDDEFITKFSATHIQTPKTESLTEEQKNLAYDRIQAYAAEALSGYEQLENKRLTAFLWDVLITTLLKIDYYCVPQGNLRNELEKTISFLNSKEDFYQRMSTAKDFLKKLQTTDKEKLKKDLYKIEIFVPYKYNANLDAVRNNLKYAYETAEKEMKAGDNIGATFSMSYGILNLFYSYNVDTSVAALLTKAMTDASEKPMQESAKILYDAIHTIMTKDNFTVSVSKVADEAQKENKGFFKKIFGL